MPYSFKTGFVFFVFKSKTSYMNVNEVLVTKTFYPLLEQDGFGIDFQTVFEALNHQARF